MSNKDKLLNISVNLARISDWVMFDSQIKQRRVDQFLKETEHYISTISPGDVSLRFRKTLEQFTREFKKLLHDRSKADKDEWAERALTWANILQHRAKLA